MKPMLHDLPRIAMLTAGVMILPGGIFGSYAQAASDLHGPRPSTQQTLGVNTIGVAATSTPVPVTPAQSTDARTCPVALHALNQSRIRPGFGEPRKRGQ